MAYQTKLTLEQQEELDHRVRLLLVVREEYEANGVTTTRCPYCDGEIIVATEYGAIACVNFCFDSGFTLRSQKKSTDQRQE